MEQIIYKYGLHSHNCNVDLPVHSKVLTVQLQNGMPHIWVLAHTEDLKETSTRFFKTFGTGETITARQGWRRVYIGTYQQGAYVWHVFEEVEY